MKIGFIGMGIMGKPMACNLLKAGYEVLVSNRHMEACEGPVSKGAKATSYNEVATNCDVVITMLPDSPQVKEVMLGSGKVAEMMHKGQYFIDCSSISPIASREINEVLKSKGIFMLDAPVSGGEPKAIDGTLSFMVGGKTEVFEHCKPILEAMGSSVVLCGDVGSGNTTKLANQIIVAANIAAVAEGLVLAKKAGVDPETVYKAIRGGLAGSTVMDAKAPMMIADNAKPGFKIDLHIKDLKNALETANIVDSPMELTEKTMYILKEVQSLGLGQSDHSAMAKYYEKKAGLKISK